MIAKVIFTSILLSLLFINGFSPNAASQDLREDAIKSHVPDQPEFDTLLKRDLIKYFSNANDKDIKVSYELLRNEPTQTGVAFPKVYLWVVVSKNGKITEQGRFA